MTPKDRYYIDYGTWMQPLVFDRTTQKVVAHFECLGFVLKGDIKVPTDQKRIFHSCVTPQSVVDKIVEELNRGEIDVDGRKVSPK